MQRIKERKSELLPTASLSIGFCDAVRILSGVVFDGTAAVARVCELIGFTKE
jgi:hypothetical protein